MKEKEVLIEIGTSRKLHNWRLHSLYCSDNVNGLIKGKRKRQRDNDLECGRQET